MSYRSLLLLCSLCCLGGACRTEIPGPPDLPAAPAAQVTSPKSLEGKLICIYCSDPKIRQKGVDSSRWGRWRSGWNLSDEPVVFSFPRGDNHTDGHTASDVIRIDYFTAAYEARKSKLGDPSHPLNKARPPRGKAKTAVDMPEWSVAPAYRPEGPYPQLTSTRKWREATEAEMAVTRAQLGLVQEGVDIGTLILQTDRAYLLRGDMFVSYKAEDGNKAALYFDYATDDNRYVGWYDLQFVTEDAGTAVQYARCRNKEIQVRPMSFRIVPMNFTDTWLYP